MATTTPAPVTEARILDLLADACKRERQQPGQWQWTFQRMTAAERLAFDLFLVRTGDPLAWEPGTTEQRFGERVARMIAPFIATKEESAAPVSEDSPRLLPPTRRAPYGKCGACGKPVEPHGVTCVYCGHPYGEPWKRPWRENHTSPRCPDCGREGTRLYGGGPRPTWQCDNCERGDIGNRAGGPVLFDVNGNEV